MKIYNTLTGQKEEIEKGGEKKLFVCGLTVYDFAHIGHARTYLAFDIIVKYLRSRGWDIYYVQNVTDVDDKIIERGRERNKSPFEVAEKYEKEYLKDMETLGVDSVDEYARASNYIDEIINQTKRLIDNGFAYVTENGIYFRVRKFEDYGKLSKQELDKLEPGARVEKDPEKEDPIDFALWKKRKEKAKGSKKIKKAEQNEEPGPVIVDGEPLWPSPWGWGRPGWHIEDTAISESLLGEQYDIHGGAEDLKFPHHESEIAQQEAASGKKPFVKLWIHAGLLNVEGKKMSKSLDNFITIRDFLEDHSPSLMRWIVLNHHYRSRMNYTEETAAEAKESLDTLKEFIRKMRFIEAKGETGESKMGERINEAEEEIHKAMNDDLNTPKAISVIFKLIKEARKNLWSLNQKEARTLREFIEKILTSFGLELKHKPIPEKVKNLAKEREELRGNEQFIKADELRDEASVLGYEIEDTPLGPFIKPTNNKPINN